MKHFIIALVLIFLAIFLVGEVLATKPAYNKTICHHTPGNAVTLNFQNVQSYNGHLGTPHNDQTYDTDGSCPEVTPTPTIEVTPTPTINPCDIILSRVAINPCITPTPTVEVTPTPTEVPTPTEEPKQERVNTGNPQAPVCSDAKPGNVANIYVKTTGNPGELEVQWALPTGADKVHIEYGLQRHAEHALLNTPNDGNEVIRGLTSGQHYWFSVAGVNGCAVGDFSDWYDPLVP